MNIQLKLFSVFILLTNTIGFAQNTLQHKVVKGESISEIAEKYHVKQETIYQLNQIIKGNVLHINAILQIPDTTVTKVKMDSISSKSIIVEQKTHIVKSGESLTKFQINMGFHFKK